MFLVTVIALSTAKTTNLGEAIYFLTPMSCSTNNILHVIHMQKIYVFRFDVEKKFLLHEMMRKEVGMELTTPAPSFLFTPVFEHIMNICFNSKFPLRIPSVSSSFFHSIFFALSLLFTRHFLFLHQNENLFKSLKQWNFVNFLKKKFFLHFKTTIFLFKFAVLNECNTFDPYSKLLSTTNQHLFLRHWKRYRPSNHIAPQYELFVSALWLTLSFGQVSKTSKRMH